jgi:1,4-dihydroxy-2-naphthoate octaprenyltransferase
VALALQIGVNYANDYSDGIRGTDEVRVGPIRLVGSRLVKPKHVLAAALGCFAVACAAGLVLAAVTSWWLLLLGAAAVAAAWFYTGGSRPYGYRALGELSVFIFFGIAAVAGTAYVQMQTLTWLPFAASAAIGLLACALLVINNLRDIPTDSETGKRTLAVVLGDQRTRMLYAGCILVPFCVAVVLAPARPLSLLALAALPLAFAPVRQVRDGASGRSLIVALGQTGRLELAYGALLTLGLAIRL